jgi:S1-C subfamily serine protease
VIIAVNSKKIYNEADFLLALDGCEAGDTIEMLVLRFISNAKPPNESSAVSIAEQYKLARELKIKLKLRNS